MGYEWNMQSCEWNAEAIVTMMYLPQSCTNANIVREAEAESKNTTMGMRRLYL